MVDVLAKVMTPFLARMNQATRSLIRKLGPVTVSMEGVDGEFVCDRGVSNLETTNRQGGGGQVRKSDCTVVLMKSDFADEPAQGVLVTVVEGGTTDLYELDHLEEDQLAWTLYLVEPHTR